MFYNTTVETGERLKPYAAAAKSQDDIILSFFTSKYNKEFTPEEVWNLNATLHCAPITSIRRSITSLTSAEFLIKTGNRKISSLGRPAHTWTVNKGAEEIGKN